MPMTSMSTSFSAPLTFLRWALWNGWKRPMKRPVVMGNHRLSFSFTVLMISGNVSWP